jgi:adenine-specific DNA-methyltransferase
MSNPSTPDYRRVELVWPGKKTQVERVKLPFQVIERVNDVRRSERGQAPLLGTELPPEWPSTWRNKLIWGDNKYVLASLLDEFAGKVDLIYIDPPFATGADFSFSVSVGESDISLAKQQTAIEEKAYRDTWSTGPGSYFQMMFDRLVLMKEFLSNTGNFFVHIDDTYGHYVKIILDEIFGGQSFRSQIVWQRVTAHSDRRGFGVNHDMIFHYSKSQDFVWNPQFEPLDEKYVKSHYTQFDESGRQFRWDNATAAGSGPARVFFGKRLEPPPGTHWRWSQERIDQLSREGRIALTREGRPQYKRFLDETPGKAIQSVWTDIPPVNSQAKEDTGFDTQKPEQLLRRVIESSSHRGQLVADFFSGSGTSLVVAEKLGRRWIGSDLGRFAVQTARKRLIDIRARPFEVLNLGQYERRYWQGITAGEAIGEYYRFIVELFHGEVIPGFAHLHGVKAGHLIHVGATDAPVTERELRGALEECKANGFTDLDVLGWEWEMGLNREGAERLVREYGVKLRLFNIPREVMDKRAVEAGDVHFFELSIADLEAQVEGRVAVIELCGFLPAIDDYMRKKVGDANLKWSGWIDYWSVDFEYDGETFINQWQAYRTRKNRTLLLRSDPHTYDKPGKHTVVVKVIDIFGNDTTQQLTVDIQ